MILSNFVAINNTVSLTKTPKRMRTIVVISSFYRFLSRHIMCAIYNCFDWLHIIVAHIYISR